MYLVYYLLCGLGLCKARYGYHFHSVLKPLELICPNDLSPLNNVPIVKMSPEILIFFCYYCSAFFLPSARPHRLLPTTLILQQFISIHPSIHINSFLFLTLQQQFLSLINLTSQERTPTSIWMVQY